MLTLCQTAWNICLW